MIELSSAQARRIWLHAQRLDTTEPFGSGPKATPAAVAHLGYVQIDPIYVIERSHHHILHTRIPSYRREHLHRAQSIDNTVFEYWAHALSYLPIESMRFHVRDMRRNWQRRSAHHSRYRQRRAGGKGLRVGQPQALEARAGNGLLQRLVTISHRAGMLKTYELLTRHFNWDRLPRARAPRRLAMRRLLESRVRRRELIPVGVEGAGESLHWMHPDYFVCPVLIGDRIVAGLDLKTDRQRQKLLVQRWNWVGRASRAHRQQVEAALHEFERFQSCR
jgi:uncharacterized protein